MLCYWGPQSRELRSFFHPELDQLYLRECCQPTSQPGRGLEWEAVHDGEGVLLERVSCADSAALLRAASASAALTALIEVHADAAGLDAAIQQALSSCPGVWSSRVHERELRGLALGSRHSKTSAERHLRAQLQQRLGRGFGASIICGGGEKSRSSAPLAPLWVIEIQRQAEGSSAAGGGQPCAAPRVLLGVELARGGAKLEQLEHRKGREGGGPTQMKPGLALATANLAALRRGAVVLDPFCGSGALLEAAAAAACCACCALGSDMAPALGGMPTADALAADASMLRLRPGCLDALICDLPYGYRASAVVPPGAGRPSGVAAAGDEAAEGGGGAGPAPHGPGISPACGGLPAWRQLLASLLRLGGSALAPGGSLVAWMPLVTWMPHDPSSQADAEGARESGGAALDGTRGGCEGQASSWLEELGAAQGLQLRYYLPESRQRGFPRAVALLHKPRGEGAAAGEAAAAAAAAAAWAPSVNQRAPQDQGKGGAQARQCLAGQQGGAVPVDAAQHGGSLLADQQEQQAQQAQRQEQPDGGEGDSQGQPAGSTRDRLRGVAYREARGVLAGKDIDLWRASWLGDTASVRSYLEAGGSADALDSKGQTALQFAAGYGKLAVVEALLGGGAGCGLARDRGRMAPLHRAAARGHAAVAALLLQNGADPCQRSASGQTPLMYAAQFGHREALGVLLEPRWHCGAAQHARRAQQEAQAQEPGNGAQEEGHAALQASSPGADPCASNNPARDGGGGAGPASLDALCGLRASVSLSDAAGLTAVHLAAQWGMAEVLRDLVLGTWACPEEPGGSGPSSRCQPAAAAAATSPGEAVAAAGAASVPGSPAQPPAPGGPEAWLLADPNCRTANEEGLAPAHLAARWGHVGVLRMLQGLGADLQIPCRGRKWTPLQEAREWSRPGCIEFLEGLERGGT